MEHKFSRYEVAIVAETCMIAEASLLEIAWNLTEQFPHQSINSKRATLIGADASIDLFAFSKSRISRGLVDGCRFDACVLVFPRTWLSVQSRMALANTLKHVVGQADSRVMEYRFSTETREFFDRLLATLRGADSHGGNDDGK